MMNPIYDAIVIGAGQAGLATGYYLQQAGLRFLILEAGPKPVGSWPYFYDSVSLNSPARYSSLPGLSFSGDPNRYPSRDEVVAYLRAYAAHFKLPVRTGARVSEVARAGQLFRVTIDGQGCLMARTVVAATGFFGRPHLPDIPGRAHYRGQVLHAADYRRPAPFGGQRVVVVGGANGAVQIGVELAQVAQVTLASRGPIRYWPQRLLGRDIHFWLKLTGLDGAQWRLRRSTPVFDTGRYQAAIAAGRPKQKPLFKRFTETGVVWADGRRETIDTVIFATGYRPHLPYLAGLGALDEAGQARQREGVSTHIPGLYYVGMPGQRNAASVTLRGAAADAKIVVKHLRRYHQAQQRQQATPSTSATPTLAATAWATRGQQLLVLMSLMVFALKGQLATRRLAAPKLVGEALIRSVIVGAGFLGWGNAAALYSR